MSRKTEAMKRKAKKNLKLATTKLKKVQAQAKVQLARHARALKAAVRRYKTSLKQA